MSNTNETYTLIKGSGSAKRGLSAEELGRRILEADEHEWDVACTASADPAMGGERYYVLRRSDGSRNSTRGARHLEHTIHACFARDRRAAETKLLEEVGRAGPSGWRGCGGWEAMTDDDYDEMMMTESAMRIEIASDHSEAEQFCAWLRARGHDARVGRSTGSYVEGRWTSINEDAAEILRTLWNAYSES